MWTHTDRTILGDFIGLALVVLLLFASIVFLVRYRGAPGPQHYTAFFALAMVTGLLFSLPALSLVASAALLALGLAWLSARYALSGLSFQRTLMPPRLFPGDEAELVTRLRNDKILPLAWISIRDPVWLGAMRGSHAPDDLLHFSEGVSIGETADPMLTHRGAIGPFQELVRTCSVRAGRRGVYSLGPARVESGDPFGFFRRTSTVKDRQEIVVYPQLYRSDEIDLTFWRAIGELMSRRTLLEDPALLAGSRQYQPGDPLRRVDWKATARKSELQVRVCDPSTTAHLMIVLNVKTFRYFWEGIDADRMEEALCVVASLATWALDRGFAVGLHSNGLMAGVNGDDDAPRIPPSANLRQATVLLEQLARLSFVGRFSPEHVLLEEARRTREGTSIIFVTAIITPELVDVLRSRRLAGRVSVVYCGSYPAPVVRGIPTHFVAPGRESSRAIS